MMNKILNKTVNKKSLMIMAVVMTILFALSIVITALVGVSYNIVTDNSKTVTVSVNDYFYNTKLEAVEDVCRDEFDKQGMKVEYVYYSELGGDDSEIVFVFNEEVNVDAAKAALAQTIAAKTADGAEWDGAIISVTSGSETVATGMPVSYAIRALVAVVVFAALAFAYVALRYRLHMGILAAIATLVGPILATVITLLTRIPLTNGALYAFGVTALLSAVFTLLTLNKLRNNLKEDDERSLQEKVVACIADKEILGIAISLAVALVLVGAIATSIVRWFALVAFIGLLVATFVGLFFVPAMYLPLRENADKRAANKPKNGYVGAKAVEKKEETVETAE